MYKHSSGVLAATVLTAGLFGGCSESPEAGVSPTDGDSSAAVATELPESDIDQGVGWSQASSAGTAASESSSDASSSSAALSATSTASSSSAIEFIYVAPANFSDTVNGAVFDMVYVAGGTYTRGCDNCAEQDKIYETPSHKVTVSDYYAATTEVTIAQWNAVMGGKKSAWA